MTRFLQKLGALCASAVACLALVAGACLAQTPVSGVGSITGLGTFSSGPGIIPATLFGLHFSLTRKVGSGGYTGIPWPPVTFGSLRLWDTNTNWMLLNQSANTYTWFASNLDPYLAAAKTNGVSDIVLTLSGTPNFISSDPTNGSCDYGSTSGLNFQETSPVTVNGGCGYPTDIGTYPGAAGTDQTWKSFIYALGAHIAGLNPASYATVSWFEMWNEFTRGSSAGGCGGEVTTPVSWEGSCLELVRMAQDADCILTGRGPITGVLEACTAGNMGVPSVAILPNAGILTPDAVPQQPDIIGFGDYVATAGALNNVDRIAVHAYAYQGLGTTLPDSSSTNSNTGASLPAMWAGLQAQLPAQAFGVPVWSTEGSWGSASNIPDPDMMMGYIARYYLVGWATGYRRLYWYSANNSFGRLTWQDGEVETSATSPYGSSGTCATTNGCPVLNSAGTPIENAWTSVYTWMVGNEMTVPCGPDASGNIWTCGMVTGGTTPALAVWDSSKSCTNGACTTSTYSYNTALYGHYETLDDTPTLHALSGGTQAIGWKPILLVP
jgi:hypothetical protein